MARGGFKFGLTPERPEGRAAGRMYLDQASPIAPPRARNFEDAPRKVGIEIEFAALTARQTAHAIADMFGGVIREIDSHRFEIADTRLGTFKAELDSRFAHPAAYPRLPINQSTWVDDLRRLASRSFGDIGSLVIPCEIVTPPITVAQVGEIDALLEQLRKAGAKGTGSSLFYAFGVHLNPDIATTDPAWLLAIVKAEILLSDWMRAVMAIDVSRQVSGFATAFPSDYAELVLRPAYAPAADTLIDEYLAYNPTRDRELDMLPLFAWLDERRVRRRLPTEKISKRPTFHFRLPNAALDQPAWSASREWNRWVLVEQLADDSARLDAMAEAYLRNRDAVMPEDWAVRSSEWLIDVVRHQPPTAERDGQCQS